MAKSEGMNVGSEEDVEQAKTSAKHRDQLKALALKRLLETEGGRLWMWDMLAQCHVFHTTFTGNSKTFFNEGERSVGLKLLADVTAVMPEFFAMMQEKN